MRKRLSNAVLIVFGVLSITFLFFPMFLKGSHPRIQVVTRVGKAKPEFIRQLAPHAKRLGKAYGVSPSLLLAQASLETDYGRSLLGGKYHNLYHLTRDKGMGVTVLMTGAEKTGPNQKTYQIYASWEACLADYLARLKADQVGGQTLYQELVTAPTLEQAAQALVENGYGQDKTYAYELLAIIREQKLEKYDD